MDSKKGQMEEGASRGRKVQTGIDWANTGIQKPAPRPNPQHPSFKPDPSRATDSPPLPWIKSSVTTKVTRQQSQPAGCRSTTPASQTELVGDPEKQEVKEKSYDWIARCMSWLDPMGFVEEINLFWYFGRNSKTFATEIIALANWGHRYMELGFCYPVPVFSNYLFSGIPKSCQVTGQLPLKLDSIQQLSSDVRARCTGAWTLMVSVL